MSTINLRDLIKCDNCCKSFKNKAGLSNHTKSCKSTTSDSFLSDISHDDYFSLNVNIKSKSFLIHKLDSP